MDRRWLKEIAWGTLLGMGSMLLAVAMIWAVGGVRFELSPTRSLSTVCYGFYLFLFTALFEENLNRGFLFQRLVDGAGVWVAQIAVALLFALSHWGNPGMHGATELWATIDLFLGSVVLGLAYLRTRSLALPVGLHLGLELDSRPYPRIRRQRIRRGRLVSPDLPGQGRVAYGRQLRPGVQHFCRNGRCRNDRSAVEMERFKRRSGHGPGFAVTELIASPPASSLHARQLHLPVHLPRRAAVRRERLFPVRRGRRHLAPPEAHLDRLAA